LVALITRRDLLFCAKHLFGRRHRPTIFTSPRGGMC
jgi:hypothetical protein